MATFDEVRTALRAGRYRSSEHGGDELLADDLVEEDVVAASIAGEVIENYPRAVPRPSCLVLSRLDDGSPVHAVWAFDARNGYAVMVTAYRPGPARWSADFRKRVKR